MRICISIIALASGVLCMLAGHPMWPPPPHSAEFRQANMVFLKFQDALASEHWSEALGFCSDRVRAAASESPAPASFFSNTVPVQILLAQDFGCWSCRNDFYGLLVPLSEPGATPVIQWYWAIYRTNDNWLVDYPPVLLESYVASKRAAIKERDSRIEQIRKELEPMAGSIQTRLVPISDKFVIGSPMSFKVELVNRGDATIHYADSGVAFAPLTLIDEQKQTLPHIDIPLQIMERQGDLAPGSLVVLADKIDLNRLHKIEKPGKYFVQFSGADLAIGKQVPQEDWGPFGETEILSVWGVVTTTNKFPSNQLQIEVVTSAGK